MNQPMYCKNCGKELAGGSNFCNHCGLNLTLEFSAASANMRATPGAGMNAQESATVDTLARLQASIGDRYQVEKELGRGGMATVYLAKDIKHDREVAIKVLLPELSASIGADRFEREIRLAAKLQHPHILGLFDSGSADGLLYYVMPFVKGESLRDRIDREGMLPIDDAIGICLEVAGALGHAHALGIVHRDIKPENILLQGEHALVADFGIARAVSEAGAQKLTQTGMAVGTPVYMAPEQSMGEVVGPTADLYSLGCVLFEMLAGEPPFTGKNAAQIMAKHAMEAVPSIRIVRSAVPEEVEGAIFAALGKMPADRPQNAAEFAELLGLMLGSTTSMRVMRGSTAVRRVPGGTPAGGVRRVTTSTALLGAEEVFPLVPSWRQPRKIATAAIVLAAAFGGWKFGGFGKPNAAGSGPDARRIAVLYFKDVSKDSSLGPLADGLTEGLIRTLGTSPSLTVISQNGVERYRNSTLADDSIARSLRAGYLVRGDVEPKGDNVSVGVNLVDASGAALRRQSFTVSARNPLAMRDTLTVIVSDMIKQQLGSELKLREQRGSTSSDAWLLLQRGAAAQKSGDAHHAAGELPARDSAFATADSLYIEAAKADGKWSDPVTHRALLAYRRARVAGANPDSIRKWTGIAFEFSNKAIEIDANDADAWEVRGNARYFPIVQSLETDDVLRRQAIDSARADFEHATSINSRQAGAYTSLSHLYYQVPSLTKTDILLAAQKALEADEFQTSANLVYSRLFNASYDLGHFDQAKQYCDQAGKRFAKDPRAVKCRLYLLTTTDAKPDIATAWKLADSSVAMYPKGQQAAETLVHRQLVAAVIAMASKSNPALADSARHVAKAAEGDIKLQKTMEPALFGARVYTILGDKAEAIRLFKAYLAANPGQAEAYGKDPGWWFKELENEPEFKRAVATSR